MVFEQVASQVVATLGLTGALADTVRFWVYDTLKISTMLAAVVFGVGYLRTYFPPEKIREYLEGKRAATGYVLAALLGIISPFCSCSTIPIFLGLVGAGVPFGITITFLAVSPMVNEAALVILPGVLGWKLTALYVASGLAVGISGGYILNRAGMERYVRDFEYGETDVDKREMDRRDRLEKSYREARDLFTDIIPYVIIGVGVGAVVHGYVPREVVTSYLSGPLGVLGAVAVGVPIYTNILGVIPVVESLLGKGLPVGTGIAFMMSVAALSLPQFVILKKVMKKELIAAYAAVLSVGIVLVGLLFNLL